MEDDGWFAFAPHVVGGGECGGKSGGEVRFGATSLPSCPHPRFGSESELSFPSLVFGYFDAPVHGGRQIVDGRFLQLKLYRSGTNNPSTRPCLERLCLMIRTD